MTLYERRVQAALQMADFYVKTTKAFDVQIQVDWEAPDISDDAVTCIFKVNKDDSDASAAITATADLSEEGADGVAKFVIPAADTDVTPGKYFYEIKWVHGDSVDILVSSTVTIKERVYD